MSDTTEVVTTPARCRVGIHGLSAAEVAIVEHGGSAWLDVAGCDMFVTGESEQDQLLEIVAIGNKITARAERALAVMAIAERELVEAQSWADAGGRS